MAKYKFIKTVGLFLIVIVLTLSMLSGCRPPEDTTDDTKTQIAIAINSGGVGTNWLRAHADRFEEEYATYKFEPDKEGIEITIVPMGLNSDAAANTILTLDEEIIFVEQCSYYELINRDAVLDITSWVTDELTEYGESDSIEDKMSEADKTFFGVQRDGDTVYYGIPWYESFPVINYDIDLFEEKGFYFAAEGQETPDGFVVNKNMPKSNGPDGKTGVIGNIDYSLDDGLPSTYEEFIRLCQKIDASYCVPLIFAGQNADYTNMVALGLHADYEGYEQMSLNYTLSGTAKSLIEFNGNNINKLDEQQINSANGYLLQKQAGRYYALDFLNKVIVRENGVFKYLPSSVMTYDHTTASGLFLSSRFTPGNEPIAMLTEATWWYNENNTTFDQMASIPGAGKLQRRIGIMPYPKVDDTRLGEATYINNWISEVVVNKNIEQEKLLATKMFYRYMMTNKSLSEFTRYSNMTRPFAYELTNDDINNTSYYGKQLVTIRNSSKIVNPWSNNKVVINNVSAFQRAGLCQSIYVNNANQTVQSNNPVAEFLLNTNPATPKLYFEGYSRYWSKAQWELAYSDYFGIGAL